MFYLLAVGGTHNDITVTGVGIDVAMQIATDALHYYWTSNEDFYGARTGMESAAANYGSDAVQQVSLAWQAVGVKTKQEDDSKLAQLSSSGGGGGGCAIGTGSPIDPSLWILLLIAGASRLHKRFN